MKLALVAATALLLSAGMSAASANSLERALLMPTVSVSLAFDGLAASSLPTRLTARFDLDSPYLARARLVQPDDGSIEGTAVATRSESTSLVRFFEFNVAGRQLASASVLGHRVVGHADRLGATEGSSSGSNWIWWTVGGLAATAATLALVGGGSDGDSSDRGPSDGPNGGCNGVSGTYNVFPEPTVDPVVLGPDCEVAGNQVPSPGP